MINILQNYWSKKEHTYSITKQVFQNSKNQSKKIIFLGRYSKKEQKQKKQKHK